MNNQFSNSQGGNQLRNQNQVKGQKRGGKKKRNLILPILLIAVGCVVFIFAAWSAVTSPVFASILNRTPASANPPHQSFAQFELAKPTYTPVFSEPVAQVIVPTSTPTQFVQEQVFVPPTATIEIPTATQEIVILPTEPPSEGVAYAEIVPDTPTPIYVAPTAVAYAPPASPGNGVRWFDVDLSDQRMYAYEGDTLVRTFVVSTGTWQTPTIKGRFKVWIKLRSAPMSGPGYYLPDVPYIMYFSGDYGIHGTYWHNNFGVPMSHGCVNLSIPDAEWAYNFASVGTVVNVHD
ncbi:MAG: L,D-transpeptidase [Anaerolineales bacterium]|nr:L,D-transpeptidase [Anaerolineales bacterium]